MNTGRAEKIRAGLFVLVSMILLFVILVLVVGLRVFEPTKNYIVRFQESVTGLEASSLVRYQGVPVGRVASIGFATDEFPAIDVLVELDPGAPVRTDTTAVLKPKGITGLYYIDLEGGSPHAAELPEGGVIVASASITFQVMQALADMGRVVKDIGTTIRNLNSVLDENKEEIGEAVNEMTAAARDSRTFLAELMKLIGETRGELGTAIQNANGTLTAIRNFAEDPAFKKLPGQASVVLKEAEQLAVRLSTQLEGADVQGTLSSIRDLISKVETLEAEVVLAIGEMRQGMTENRGVVNWTLSDLREFTRNLKILSREIREEPSRLFFDSKKSKGRSRR